MSYSSWTTDFEKVNVRFTTHYDVSNENDVVGVIGSSKYIGNWDPENALLLERRGVKGCWSSMVKLPLSTYFEWKLIVIDRLTRKVHTWEDYPNRWNWIDRGPIEIIAGWNSKELTRCSSCRCLVGLCCCTTIYTNLEPKESHVKVTFRVIHSIEEENETIALVGSSKFLGDWDPTYSRLFSAQHNPILTIQLPVNTCFQWKLAVLDSQHRKVVHWEECENRSLSIQTCPLEIGVTWNKTAECGYRCFWLDPEWVVAPCPCGRRYCNNKDIQRNENQVKDLLDIFDNKRTSDDKIFKQAIANTSSKDKNRTSTKKQEKSVHFPENPVSRVFERDEGSDDSPEESFDDHYSDIDEMLDNNHHAMKIKTDRRNVTKDEENKKEHFHADNVEQEKNKEVIQNFEVVNSKNTVSSRNNTSKSHLRRSNSKEIIDMFESLRDKKIDRSCVAYSGKVVMHEHDGGDSNTRTFIQIASRSSVPQNKEMINIYFRKGEKLNLTENPGKENWTDMLTSNEDGVYSDQQQNPLSQGSIYNGNRYVSNVEHTFFSAGCSAEQRFSPLRSKTTTFSPQRDSLFDDTSEECAPEEPSLRANKMQENESSKSENKEESVDKPLITNLDNSSISLLSSDSLQQENSLSEDNSPVCPSLQTRQVLSKKSSQDNHFLDQEMCFNEITETCPYAQSLQVHKENNNEITPHSVTLSIANQSKNGSLESDSFSKELSCRANLTEGKALETNNIEVPKHVSINNKPEYNKPVLRISQLKKCFTNSEPSFNVLSKSGKHTEVGVLSEFKQMHLVSNKCGIPSTKILNQNAHAPYKDDFASDTDHLWSDAKGLNSFTQEIPCKERIAMDVELPKAFTLQPVGGGDLSILTKLFDCKRSNVCDNSGKGSPSSIEHNEMKDTDVDSLLGPSRKIIIDNGMKSSTPTEQFKKLGRSIEPSSMRKQEKHKSGRESLLSNERPKKQSNKIVTSSPAEQSKKLDWTVKSSLTMAQTKTLDIDRRSFSLTGNDEKADIGIQISASTGTLKERTSVEKRYSIRQEIEKPRLSKPLAKNVCPDIRSLTNKQHNTIFGISVTEKKTVKLVSFSSFLKCNTLPHKCQENDFVPLAVDNNENIIGSEDNNTRKVQQTHTLSTDNISSEQNEIKKLVTLNITEKTVEKVKSLQTIVKTETILCQPNEQEEVQHDGRDCTENSSNISSIPLITAASAFAAVVVCSCIFERFVHK